MAIEDHGFFDHGAVDFAAIVRAALKNIEAGARRSREPRRSPSSWSATSTSAPRTDDQAKADRSAPRLRGGGSALEDLDPHRLPEHGALRHGRRPDRGRRRGGGADLLRQAGQGARPDRGGADRRPAPGALRIQPVPRSRGPRKNGATRCSTRWRRRATSPSSELDAAKRQRPRPQPGEQVQGDPRPVPLRPGPAGADRQIRDQHGPHRRASRPTRRSTPNSRNAPKKRSSSCSVCYPEGGPAAGPRLGQPRKRRDRRPRLDRRLCDRKPVQLRLAGPSPARAPRSRPSS